MRSDHKHHSLSVHWITTMYEALPQQWAGWMSSLHAWTHRGHRKQRTHIHQLNTHRVSDGVKPISAGHRPSTGCGQHICASSSPSGWTELASGEQRGSQWDHITDGVGEMVRAQSCRAFKAMEGVQILFKTRWTAIKGLCRGMIAFYE